MTPYRHAYLVARHAGKGCKLAAQKALERVVADMLRDEARNERKAA